MGKAPKEMLIRLHGNAQDAGELSSSSVGSYLGVPYLPARAVSMRATSSITALGARSRMAPSAV